MNLNRHRSITQQTQRSQGPAILSLLLLQRNKIPANVGPNLGTCRRFRRQIHAPSSDSRNSLKNQTKDSDSLVWFLKDSEDSRRKISSLSGIFGLKQALFHVSCIFLWNLVLNLLQFSLFEFIFQKEPENWFWIFWPPLFFAPKIHDSKLSVWMKAPRFRRKFTVMNLQNGHMSQKISESSRRFRNGLKIRQR